MRKNKKNIRYSIDEHHHGLFVKEARLRQGYRLIEVANEICDTSYLSKVESGIIVPPLDIFEKIAEKLDIRFPSSERMCPIELFRKSLYQEDVNLIESYLTSDIFHHYEIQLIKFFQTVVKDQLSEAFILKKLIDQLCRHFNEKEEQSYMLFSGIYFFKNFEWESGIKCFKKALDLTYQIKEEDPYLYFELAKYHFRIQKTYLGFSYLERATTEFKKNFEKAYVFKCGILWCRESIKNDHIRHVEIRLEELKKIINPCKKHLQWNDFFNIAGMVSEKHGKNIQAEEYYTKSIEPRGGKVNEDYIIDKIKFHYHRQNGDQLIKLIERLDISHLSVRNRMIIDFYYLKASEEFNEHFEDFLRKDAIPFAMKGLDCQYVELYTKELTKYNRNKRRHKKAADAYYKWEKFYDDLNALWVI